MRWQTGRSVRHETLGADTAASHGATVTSGSGGGNKGSWVNVGSTTSFTYEALTLFFTQGNVSNDVLIDLGISVSGNRYVIFPDLRLAGQKNNRTNAIGVTLPLRVPAGAQLSVRAQSDPAGTATHYATITGHSAGLGGMPGYSRALALYSETDSRGVDVECTVVNTKTSWVETTSGISLPVEALMLCCGPGAEVTRASFNEHLVDVAIGAGGSEEVILANLQFVVDLTFDVPCPQYVGPIPNHIPASTRVAVRAQGSGNTAGERKIDLALWGFVQ